MRDLCTYCAQSADGRDHVPPRCLLERPYPPNLPTVPACDACNQGYSLDEEYFLTVLAQVGVSEDLAAKVEPGGRVDRALRRSAGLENRIRESLALTEEGLVAIEPEVGRLRRVVRKIAAGLYALRYGQRAHPSSIPKAGIVHLESEPARTAQLLLATHTERFQPKRWSHVQRGVFSYIFVRNWQTSHQLTCVMDFHGEFWGAARVPIPSRGPASPSGDDQMELTLE